ncbi:MAG: PQQ-binding-like beta-propeller repeat protein, partial [Gemmataceae bacterium]
MPTLPRCLLSLSIVAGLCPLAQVQEWARFRGPNGTGLNDAQLPAKFTEKDFLWKAKVPGAGHSSPVLWGERIFVTSADSKTGDRLVLCYGAKEGNLLWQRKLDGSKYKMHRRNSIATSTPAADEKHVYISWGVPEECLLMALDHNGKDVWKTPLGPFKGNHGFGASPIVFQDMVVMGNDQDGKGYLIALDRDTGKERWKLPRDSGNATYSTPCVYQPKGQDPLLIFTNWQRGVSAVDPKNGKLVWELSCFQPELPERAIASPVIAGNLILGTCGFVTKQKHFVAIDPNKGQPKEVWRVEKAVSYLPTPIVKNGRVFLCSELGIASCLDPATGKLIWQERLNDDFS